MDRLRLSLQFGAPLLAAGPLLAQPQVSNHSQGHEAPAPSNVMLHWGDFDGNGRDDALAITPDRKLRLMENSGDGSFQDITEIAQLASIENVSLAVWEDFDGDSQLDLFIGTNQGACHLLKNDGGLFIDVAAECGIDAAGWDRSAHWIDYDGDKRLDLHLIYDGKNVFYHALPDGTFEVVPLPAVLVESQGPGQVSPEGPTAPEGGESPNVLGGSGNSRTTSRTGSQQSGTGSVSTPVAQGFAGGPPPPGTLPTISGICAQSLKDTSGGNCLRASSSAELGKLYPLSQNLFVEEASGEVGIGTTSPSAPLHVRSNAGTSILAEGSNNPGIRMRNTTGGLAWSIFHDSSNDLVFRESFNGITRMTLRPQGRLGIGTTSPTRLLHVSGGSSGVDPTTNSTLVVENDGEASISIISPSANEASIFLGNPAAGNNAAAMVFNPFSGPANGLVLRTDDTNRIVIDADGDVGIGTNNPGGALHVTGFTRQGSETGTSQGPETNFSYEGMITRRVTSTVTTLGSVVARSRWMTIERDGTSGGFALRWEAGAIPDQTVTGTVLTSSGVVPVVVNLGAPASSGVQPLVPDILGAVRIDLAFGTTFNTRELTELTLVRSAGDDWWVGSIRTTWNQ